LKFLCDQCKAKYQISDDKIAGKTVRMKCRKCGHQIEVRAAVTESSVSSQPPRAGASDRPAETQKTPFGAPRPGAPRPGGLATSLSSAKPAPAKPATLPTGALASAFSRTVQKDEHSNALELLELSAADEWYVAINSVPVGPIRIAELRRKAAAGAVTEESLVWQEGMEEWRPVKALPELASVVRDAAAGGRMALVTPAPGDVRASAPPPAPRVAPTPAPGPTALQRIARPAAPPMGAPATARSNVVPITSRLATAERLENAQAEPQRVSVAPDPFAMPPPAAVSSPLLGPPASAFSQPGVGGPFAPSLHPLEPPKKGPPWIAIAMIVLALAFGITAGIVVFYNGKQPPPQPVVIQVPMQPQAQPTATATATTTIETPAAPPPTTTASAPKGTSGSVAARPAATSTGKGGNAADITSLLGGAGGPTQGPSGGGGPSGGSSQLTSDQVQAVVRNRSAGVKRTCWERGGGEKAGTVSVRVLLSVSGSGQVTEATASGPDPIMNKCIENQVRTWQFPPTGGTSKVEIPFHFVAQ
jgi:predicted Zn finger-like uncharacterized protein